MTNKYKIGEHYLLNVFLEPEEMEYLGEVVPKFSWKTDLEINFQVFKRFHYGRPDLLVLFKGEFFTRSDDDTVEGAARAVNSAFTFEGKGYKTIKVGENRLTIDEFKKQVEGLLTEEAIEKAILTGSYVTHHKNGEIKWCPKCEKIRQTDCCACGCGSCQSCGHRWICNPFTSFSLPRIKTEEK